MTRAWIVTVLITVALAAPVPAPAPAAAAAAIGTDPSASSSVAPAAAYSWPLPGTPRVGRGFDPPDHPYGRGHRGVDLVAAAGTPVLAAGAGTVVFAGALAGRGVVSVQHPDGLRTTYEPVTASVAAGQGVVRGQVLGTLDVGHAGCAAAACLHWGVRRGRLQYLDPLRLIGTWDVRLLPWI